jgi:hypothetical protein
MKYRRQPTTVDAYQYGDAEGWHPTSVQLLARFIDGADDPMRHPDGLLPPGDVMQYLQPTGLWDPPDSSTLLLWVAKSNKWCELELGDWVIRESDGIGVYPCKGDIFAATYNPVDD